MSGAQDSRGEAQAASSLLLNARQVRALAALLDAFDTGDPDNPAHVEMWCDSYHTIRVHAAVSDAPEDDIEIFQTEDGRFFGHDANADTIRWLTPIRLASDQTTERYPYRGGLACYRSGPNEEQS